MKDNVSKHSTGDEQTGISWGQIMFMICFGVIGWFTAAMVVRFGAPAGLFQGWNVVFLYVLTILIWIPGHVGIKKALRLRQAQIVPALSVGIGTAAICDGIAIPSATALYGNDAMAMFHGTGWILWFVGVGLIVAFLDARRLP